MDLWQALYHRRAVRDYSDAPVAPSLISRLVEAAVQAPSAVNAQPWLFTVIRDQNLLDTISAKSKEHMLKAIDLGRGPAGFREHLSNPDFQIFYHAPALVVISALKSDEWAAEGASLAASNLMLAACAEGIGSCWIGFAQRWLETDGGRCVADIPPDFRPIAPIILGHPKSKSVEVPRKAPTIHWIG